MTFTFTQSKGASYKLAIFSIIYCVAVLSISYLIEPMHDYALYFRHWDLVLSGGDPWQKMAAANAYGPIYNLFAWLYVLDYQLPKLVFVSSWLVISVYAVNQFWNLPKVSCFQKWLYFVFWFCNPFFILSTVFYAFNDTFVALLMFIGLLLILQYQKKELGIIVITLGILTKLYPLFLLPFISTHKKEIVKYALIFIFLISVVYFLTYLVWGVSFTNALGKANGRDPTLFSVMRFVDGAYFPSTLLRDVIIGLTNLLVLLGVGYVFKCFKDKKIDQATAFLAGFTMLLLFYKAGQQQFYLAYFAIFAVWVMLEFKKDSPNVKAFYSILFLGVWFAVMAGLVYPLTHNMEGEYLWIRDIIGLPTFLIQLVVIFFLLNNAASLQNDKGPQNG